MEMQTQRRLLKHWIINRIVLPMAETSQVGNRLRAILRSGAGRRAVSRRNAAVAVLLTMAVLTPIALLRFAPASAHLLTSSSPTPSFIEASAKSAMLYDTLPSNPAWTRQIGKGVAVELIGVSAQTAQRKWWRPDGQPITQNLHEDTPTPFFSDNLEGHKTMEFAFRVTNATGQTVNVDYNVPGSFSQGSGTYEGDENEADIAYAATDEHRINHNTNGFRLLGVGLPNRAAHVTMRVGIASGAWKDGSIWPWPSQTTGYSTTTLAGVFAFSSMIEANKQSTLTITDTALRQDFQVIAIDQQGHEQTAFSAHDVTNGPFRQTTVIFNLPFSQIKSIHFQVRPYKWVEFKNVALEPQPVDTVRENDPVQAKKDFIAAVHAHNQQIVQAWNMFERDIPAVYKEPDARDTPETLAHLFAPNYTMNGLPMDAREAARTLQAQVRKYGLNRHAWKIFVGNISVPKAPVTIVTEGRHGSLTFSRLDVWMKMPQGWRLTASTVSDLNPVSIPGE